MANSEPRTERPLALDLFCGAGGMGMGLWRAGFDVVGVDIASQPRYPFPFIRADALEVLSSGWLDMQAFALVHASPPCQHYSDLAGRNGNADAHPDLIGRTERGLGVDGYRLRRHRLFESNLPIETDGCDCAEDSRPIIDVSGGGPTHAPRLDGGGGRTYKGTVAQKRTAMGIGWMTGAELVEAIPPAYGELIGSLLVAALHGERMAA